MRLADKTGKGSGDAESGTRNNQVDAPEPAFSQMPRNQLQPASFSFVSSQMPEVSRSRPALPPITTCSDTD
jgi:hypothetical protein